MYHKSIGRLYIYDVTTGNIVGSIQFAVDWESNVIGIQPNGKKVNMKGDIQGVKNLLVIDVVNFKVVKTIKMPDTVLFMIFYDE